MLDEERFRSIIREEIERFLPQLQSAKRHLTIQECMRRYGRRSTMILDLVRKGEVEAKYLPRGRNGRPQYLVVTESADNHPRLGGSLGMTGQGDRR